jgi:hypothetical protein
MTLRMDAFFVCIGILFILVSGCLAPVSPAPEPMMQITTVSTAAPETTTLSETHGAVFTRDEVGELFIDIAFGCDTTQVHMFVPSSENHLFFSLEGQVNDHDIEYVRKFTKEYNLLTPIEVFSEDPLSSTGSPIIVYPRESLESLDKRFIACQETDPGSGDPLFLVYTPVVKNPVGVEETTTRIYLNAALQGVGRDHYLQKAMLYYLGFPGQTYTYPESVFYYDTNSTLEFTPIDNEAMKTMYHPGIYPGMSVQEVRWLLLND